jgi:hypothetical protein
MSEYRRAKRRRADHTIQVIDTMTEQAVGRIGNLSETGCLLVLTEPAVNDALYQFRFNLDGQGNARFALEVGAHELWQDDAAAPGQVWAGFRFIDMSVETREHIRHWVNAPGSDYV